MIFRMIPYGRAIVRWNQVLANSCEYFQHLFTGAMALTELPATISMPEWVGQRSAVMLFSHIYDVGALNDKSGTLDKSTPESFQVVLDILLMADMYGFAYAKQWSEEWLASSSVLDIWNVCTMLSHAHKCNAEQLTRLCVHHVRSQWKMVERTTEWQELPDELKMLVFGRAEES
jgi:hypothetical protein